METRLLLWLYLVSAAWAVRVYAKRRDVFPPRCFAGVVATALAAAAGLLWPERRAAAFLVATTGFALFFLLPAFLVRSGRSAARRGRFAVAARLVAAGRLLLPARFLAAEADLYRRSAAAGAAPPGLDAWLARGDPPVPFRRAPVAHLLPVVFGAVFLLLVVAGSSESALTLLEFGASSGPLVRAGEWFRLVTAIFLHVGLLHLLMNGLAVFVVGRWVEPEFGSAATMALFFLGGLLGNVASHFAYAGAAEPLLSAGASGGGMALLGAALVAAWRRPPGTPARARLGPLLLIVGATLLLGVVEEGIDNGAHLGGLLVGAAVAVLLTGRRRPPARVVRTAGIASGLLALVCFGLMLSALPRWRADAEFAGPGFAFRGPAFFTPVPPPAGEADAMYGAGPLGDLAVTTTPAPDGVAAEMRRELARFVGKARGEPDEILVEQRPPAPQGRWIVARTILRGPGGAEELHVYGVDGPNAGRATLLFFHLPADDPLLRRRVVEPVVESFRFE